jgi:hypothetical protein
MANIFNWTVYKCYKKVVAAQIAKLTELENGDIFITLMNDDPIVVPPQFIERHNPEIEGYLVCYADGYMSYSPKKAFEEGYVSTDRT